MSCLRNKGIYALWLVSVWLSVGIAAEKTEVDPYGRKVVAGELIVKLRSDLILPQSKSRKFSILNDANRRAKGRLKRTYRTLPQLALIEVADGVPLENAMAEYKRSGLVESVSYNFVRSVEVLPDDALLNEGRQWGLDNSGQWGGVSGADIGASEGWDRIREAPEVIVAILDSGIRYTHEDLAANMWVNSGEIAANGIDDDGNGYVDDVHGINTVGIDGERTPETEGDPADDLGHGTHVAGIVGAVGDNGLGVSGVAWKVKLMALKFLDSRGEGSDADAIECIDYARANGARIINSSWGGLDFNPLLGEAIAEANESGIYFVASAGNQSSNNDDRPSYPASYAYPNVVTVTATDKRDGFASFANYGESEVELAAPGVSIQSTYFNSDDDYRALSGTSMAAPFVSGALALLITQFPEESMATVLNRLYSSTDTLESLARRCRVGGRLNIARALEDELSVPFNDDFSNATPLINAPLSVSGFTSTGSLEVSEPSHDPDATGRSIWWSWNADTTGFAEATTEGSDFNTVLAIYTGESLDALQLVAKDRDLSPEANGASLGFEAVAGQTYRIAVDGLNGGLGNVSLSLGQSVVNDDFQNASLLKGLNVRATSENIAASKESGEPDHVEGAFGEKSVWWRWTAPLSGNVTMSTSASNSFDTIMAVYTGDTLNQLTPVASNDDDVRTGVWTSSLTFFAQEGVEYRIAVDGWNGGFGEISLTIAMAENDDFEDSRIYITDAIEDVSFTNVASSEIGEINHAGTSVGKSLWWKWTSTRSGQAEVATFGSDFDTTLAVYRGEAIGSLNLVAANDDSGGALSSRLAFEVEAGETYFVAVDGNDFREDRSYGLAKLSIAVEEDPSWGTPIILKPDPLEIEAGDPIDFTYKSTGGASLYAATGLPNGLTIDAATGEVSGTATQSGLFEIRVEASNENGTGVFLHRLEIGAPPGSPAVGPLPLQRKAVEGEGLDLSVSVADETGVTYQWYKDGDIVPNATERVFSIESMNASAEGDYSVSVANANGSVLVGSMRVRMIREALLNISTRGFVGTGPDVMIAGFVVSGTQPRQVLIRGLGKSLEAQSELIEGALEDPRMTLYNSANDPIRVVDDWKDQPNWELARDIGVSVGAEAPVFENEVALLITLDPGLYTAVLSGADGGTGLGLVEVFDATDDGLETRLVNIATRVWASTGQKVAIGGFVISGEDPKRVLIRALGPELLKRDIEAPLPDPYMSLYRGSEVVAFNDDWSSENRYEMLDAFDNAGATILDDDSSDAAMVRALLPGLYTVVINDFNSDSGIALVEVYELP